MIRPEIRKRVEMREDVPTEVADVFVDMGVPGRPDMQLLGTLDSETKAEGVLLGWKWCRETYQKLWG